jgi:alpha-tubulin suppressor-like RCC1 family protein
LAWFRDFLENLVSATLSPANIAAKVVVGVGVSAGVAAITVLREPTPAVDSNLEDSSRQEEVLRRVPASLAANRPAPYRQGQSGQAESPYRESDRGADSRSSLGAGESGGGFSEAGFSSAAPSPAGSRSDASSYGAASATKEPGSSAAAAAASGDVTTNSLVTTTSSATATEVSAAAATYSVRSVSGDGQSGAVGATLAAAFVGQAMRADTSVPAGATVTWTISGGGSLVSASSTVDAEGYFSTFLTLGPLSGTHSVTATVRDSGGSGSVSFSATAISSLEVSGVSPSKGAVNATNEITITGTGFESGATVTVGGSTCTGVSVVSSTSITCETSALSLGGKTILVTNADGSSDTLASAFTVVAADVRLLEGANPSFGNVLVNTSADLTVHVSNVSPATRATALSGSALAAPFTYKGGTFPGTGGTCAAILEADSACTIVLTFAPTAVGTGIFTQAFTLSFHDGDSADTTLATFEGRVGSLSQNPARLAKGSGRGMCLITHGGEVKCWGLNRRGVLGNGSSSSVADVPGETGDGLVAVSLGTGRSVAELSQGVDSEHVCAILDNGSVKCWGRNSSGQLGLGDTVNRGRAANQMGDNLAAVSLGTGRTATQVVTGEAFTCALLDNGSVKCWGNNQYGQLGQGSNTTRGDNAGEMGDSLAAVSLGTGRTAIQLAAGRLSACALLDNATVKCWGYNGQGQLGIGAAGTKGTSAAHMGDSLLAVSLGTGRTAVKVVGGYYHFCALLDNSSVKCWGYNIYGQLGQGDATNRGLLPAHMGDNLLPVSLGTGRTATDLGSGSYHSCAILDSGELKCWGYNTYASLGQGNTSHLGDGANEMGDFLGPISLGTGRSAVAVSGGVSHTCATLDDFTLKCWGDGAKGQLGNGAEIRIGDAAGEMGDALPVVNLGTGKTVKDPGLGASVRTQKLAGMIYGACVVLNDNSLRCFGDGRYGVMALGRDAYIGDEAGDMGAALPVINLGTGRTAKEIGIGGDYACAILDNDSVKCWGANSYGQLGLGDTNDRGDHDNEMGDNLPAVDLGAGRTAKGLAVGTYHACALLDNGSVKCWGYNGVGGLGLGDVDNRGDGAGEMGDTLSAVSLGAGRTAVQISAGNSYTCAVLDNGSLKCWGYNGGGGLGLGDTADRGDGADMGDSLPAIDLGSGRTATKVMASWLTTCALLDNATVKCWGSGAYGAHGGGSTSSIGSASGHMGDSLTALDFGSGRTVRDVLEGVNHNCALLDNDTMKCWGYNAQGSLGLEHMNTIGDTAGEMGDSLPAVSLGTGRTVRALGAGYYNVCAILDNESLKCWGYNAEGQLGLGDINDRGDAASEMGDSLPAVSTY